ncbi:MAG: aspartate--tRNA(Asn) ligase [Lachnospiraceae bacterium]|jgi:nondiscriminating aspartyl-tRNA synthetase|nr:aspartate--tRNA(Asn) ligase [Lachnospiraceae bacterium]
MKMVAGITEKQDLTLAQLKTELQLLTDSEEEKRVLVRGMVSTVRQMGEVAFIILRKADGMVQCVCEKGMVWRVSPETQPGHMPEKKDAVFDPRRLREESAVEICGVLRAEQRAPQGLEIGMETIRILSEPAEAMPVCISKGRLAASLETQLNLRGIMLRHVKERAKFRIQEGLVRGFRDFLHGQGFTEIHTPKIVARGAEGGANIFRLDYFGKKAELAQSPQLYKQTMVGVYDRVFEVGPVFRAEKHSTARHLNEYTGLDFEMGYIDSFEEIMEMEAAMLRYTMELLEKDYGPELTLLQVEVPGVKEIPQVSFHEAKRLVSAKYGRSMRNPGDLEPEEEQLIGRYFKEEKGSDFVFVTHYPSKKRPFYAMDDPEDPRVTLSFDLLFRGLEITTGGQRIHDYRMLLDKMERRGMDPTDMESYLMIFRHGMPPHGGLGIGLERLTMQLLGEDNVRETAMFPRDLNRLEP